MGENESTLVVEEPSATAPAHDWYSTVQYACHSIPGTRETNQDTVLAAQVLAKDETIITAAVLCDGMGGHQSGETAAQLAAQTSLSEAIRRIISHSPDSLEKNMPDLLLSALQAANIAVITAASNYPDHRDMGTTLVIAVLVGTTLYVASVGDSRCYLYREETLEPLTHDDSFVQILVDSGHLTPQEAENHPRSNEITRCIGSVDALDDLGITIHTLQPGDRVVLCSDGLWKDGGGDIHAACARLSTQSFTSASLRRTVMELTEHALARGSDDNISAALIWLGPENPATPCNQNPNSA